ncbi:MAG: hypothetical protein ACLGI2_16210 [Acidimicrobiia bacterium]
MEIRIGTSDRLFVSSRRNALVITVRGVLDAVVVKAVAAIVAAKGDADVTVDVDLHSITGHTDGGVAALAGLAGSQAITYRAGSEAAQAVLRELNGAADGTDCVTHRLAGGS